jgi:hypothetical protein
VKRCIKRFGFFSIVTVKHSVHFRFQYVFLRAILVSAKYSLYLSVFTLCSRANARGQYFFPTLAPEFVAPSRTPLIRDPIELYPGTVMFLHPEDVRTAVDDRNMVGVSLMILLREALANVEWTNTDFFPIILAVPTLTPLPRQFEDMRTALTQALLALIQEYG